MKLFHQITGVVSRSDVGFLSWSIENELSKNRSLKAANLATVSTITTKLRGLGNRSVIEPKKQAIPEDEEDAPPVNFDEVDHQKEARKLGVGSRLKTPFYPVWVTLCKETFGLLFNPNKELTRDYHAENR